MAIVQSIEDYTDLTRENLAQLRAQWGESPFKKILAYDLEAAILKKREEFVFVKPEEILRVQGELVGLQTALAIINKTAKDHKD